MTDTPFTFEGCDSPSVCRDGLRPLLATGQDWSEVHCGRCGKTGIVRHADLVVAPAENTAVADPDPVEEPVEPEAPVPPAGRSKGGSA